MLHFHNGHGTQTKGDISKETWWEILDWIRLAQFQFKRKAFINTVMNFRFR